MADSSNEKILLYHFSQFQSELTDGAHGLHPVSSGENAETTPEADQYLCLQNTKTGKTQRILLRDWYAQMTGTIRNAMARLSARESLGMLLVAYARQLSGIYNDQNVNFIVDSMIPAYPPSHLAEHPCSSNYGIYLTGMLLADPYLSLTTPEKKDTMKIQAERRMARNQSQQVLRLSLPAQSWLPDYQFPLAALRFVDPQTYPYKGNEVATDKLVVQDPGADGLLMKPYPYLSRDQNNTAMMKRVRWHCNQFVGEALFCTLLYYYRVRSNTPLSAFSFEDPQALEDYRRDAFAVHGDLVDAGLISGSFNRYLETKYLYIRLNKLQKQNPPFLPAGISLYYRPQDTAKNNENCRAFDTAYLQRLISDLADVAKPGAIPPGGACYQPQETAYLVFFGSKHLSSVPSHVEIVTSMRVHTLAIFAKPERTTLVEFTAIGAHESHAYETTYQLCHGAYTCDLPKHDRHGKAPYEADQQDYTFSGLHLRQVTSNDTPLYRYNVVRFVKIPVQLMEKILDLKPWT